MTTNLELVGYLIYLPVIFIITTFVTKLFFKNSLQFMLDIFHQDNKIAESTNVLFKIGFYLINMGFALVIMELKYVQDMTGLAEDLSSKIGGYSMYLGFILLLFLLFFLKGRKSARLSRRKLQES